MIYLAIKYHPDNKNKDLILSISDTCKSINLDCINIMQHVEKWGDFSFDPQELMRISFETIRKCQFVLIEFSEKGVGIGLEAGYAYALNIPVYVIHPPHVEVSNTLKGIATAIFPYESVKTLPLVLKQIKDHFYNSFENTY
ncbi:MAG: nucleoside 2-deoxyribosyltransferase [Anaerolineaceae bacterium]|nr:nucleoside 2-deoxyribosyltransferase [Anaerolineaceae bacterium]